MREQRAHLRAMWEAEESKKKTDSGKVNQYKEQYEELGRQIEDTIAEITESVTQTSAKDLATQLSDAIAEAYSDGFNSDKVKSAIEKVTNQVLGNAVKNANTDSRCIHEFNHTVTLGSNLRTRIACQLAFDTGTYNRSFALQ